jgi:hypothetical protein
MPVMDASLKPIFEAELTVINSTVKQFYTFTTPKFPQGFPKYTRFHRDIIRIKDIWFRDDAFCVRIYRSDTDDAFYVTEIFDLIRFRDYSLVTVSFAVSSRTAVRH